jgi:lactoylglutathione lyase
LKLGYTILYVSNVAETLQFYLTAFGIEKKFIHEGGDYGELSTGETTLAFVSLELAESNKVGFIKNKMTRPCNEMEIALVSEDVESAFIKAVSAGAVEVAKPLRKPWGQTVSYVRDPDGFLIEICSPIG